VLLEGLGQWKISITSSGLKRDLPALRLNQLRCRVSHVVVIVHKPSETF
jgi:hypothetical protein